MLKKLIRITAAALAVVLLNGVAAYAAPTGASVWKEAMMQSSKQATDQWIGYYFEAKQDMTVTALGRPGQDMAQEHRILLWETDFTEFRGWDPDKHTAKIIADVTVKPGSPTENGFKYETLKTPVTLKAGVWYFFVSLEYADGDPVLSKGGGPISEENITDYYDTNMIQIWGSARSGDGVTGTAAEPAVPAQPSGSVSNLPIYSGVTFWYTLGGAPADDKLTITVDKPIVVDGNALGTPYIQNGEMMVPLRAVSEAMGARVDWVNSTAVIEMPGIRIEIKPNTQLPNGTVAELRSDGRIYVPLVYVSKILGVKYELDANSVTIFK